jgi:serine/threonine protein kinase
MIADLRHRTGERIQDRYEIEGELGAGAFGTVYRCRDTELETLVAIKELHVLDDPNLPGDGRALALAQFRREAIHLSHLRHPHIVSGHYQPHGGTWLICPVCGLSFRGAPTCPDHNAPPIVVRQRHYLVMEYIDGPDLETAASRSGGVLPIEATCEYLRQIAEALKMIHARGWVHRDIKPENIRLRRQTNDAVLLDFGIATESGEAGEFSTRAQRHTQGGGTLGYAPDTPNERRFPDARSDIHALGMTMYRLLSGSDPLEPDDLSAMRRARPSDFNRNISAPLDDLILRCINRDPNVRPQSAAEFLVDLNAIAKGPEKAATTTLQSTLSSPSTALAAPFSWDSGESSGNLTQLVKSCDKYPREAVEYLFNGDFGVWLEGNGRADIARRAGEIRREYASQRAQGLEAFIQFSGVLPPPQLRVTPEAIDFGIVQMGTARSLNLHVENSGRGHLFGRLKSRYSHLEFPPAFDGNAVDLPFAVNASGLMRGEYEGDITIDSSGGEVRVPFRFTLHRKRSPIPFFSVVLWSLLGMLSGLMLRTLPFAHEASGRGHDWLSSSFDFGAFDQRWAVSILFGFAMWASLMLLIVGEATRKKSCGIFLSGTLAAGSLAIVALTAAPQIIVAGDEALRPLTHDLVQSWAGGGWMSCGAIAGAIYGTLRRSRDVFTTRLWQIAAGWAVSMMILLMIILSIVASGLPPVE